MVSLKGIDGILQELLQPGYKLYIGHSLYSSTIDIKICNPAKNTYQICQIAEESIYKHVGNSKAIVDYLIDVLGQMGGIDGWIPNYQRNFDTLMKQILNCETIPGKLYS